MAARWTPIAIALPLLSGCGTLAYYAPLDDPDGLGGETGLDSASGDDDDDTTTTPTTTPGDDDDDTTTPTTTTPPVEDCGDGVDNDGDGARDCADLDCETVCDADGDGFDGQGYGGTDCDDTDPNVNPSAAEVCDDGIDNDCAGGDCSQFRDDFESALIAGIYTLSGAQLWAITAAGPHGGNYAAISGPITHNQISSMSVSLDFPTGGSIEFWHKGDTESGYDYLQFYIDGVQRDQWSGTWPWQVANYNVAAGVHTLEWRYDKDGSVDRGADAVAIDDIVTVGGIP